MKKKTNKKPLIISRLPLDKRGGKCHSIQEPPRAAACLDTAFPKFLLITAWEIYGRGLCVCVCVGNELVFHQPSAVGWGHGWAGTALSPVSGDMDTLMGTAQRHRVPCALRPGAAGMAAMGLGSSPAFSVPLFPHWCGRERAVWREGNGSGSWRRRVQK